MALVDLIDKLTPVLVVIIPSYFSFKSSKNTKEADQKLRDLSDKIDELEKPVLNVEENLKNALKRGYTNQHEIEELSRLYESYIELGGNGAIKVLFERFLDLEIKEEN